MIVVMFTEYSATVVVRVSSRSTVNEPRIARPPIARGTKAAMTLPKISTSRISRTGSEMDSARAMLPVTALLTATSVGTVPPTLAVIPSAGSRRRSGSPP